jgi:DNA-binding transcriptional LysR family regulator
MEIDDLRLFVTTVSTGSLTEAARHLHVPKSSASRSIARLEEAVGISLLYRSTRKLMLTEAGSQLLDHATAILERWGEARSGLEELRKTPYGTLKVSAPVNPGQFLIAPLLGRFLERYPEVDVRLTLTGEAIDPLTGAVDIAIRTGELKDSSLLARRLGVAHLGLYASTEYLEAKGTPRAPQDLAGHTLVDIAERGDTWDLTSSKQQVVNVPVHCRLLVNDTTIIRTVVLSGFAMGWLPTYMAEAEVNNGQIKRVLTDWSRGARKVHALFASHRLISPKVRAFVDFMAENLVFPQ